MSNGSEHKKGLPPINLGDESDQKMGAEDLFTEETGGENRVQGSSRIQTFAGSSKLSSLSGGVAARSYKRSLNKTGQGAMRTRTFHSKLNASALSFMDDQINEWIDENSDVEVKFVNTTVGVFESKRPEPHLIVTVWY